MSEVTVVYRVNNNLLQSSSNPATITTEADTLRVELEELERRLIPLLVTVQKALGKEPSVMTPEQRRRAAVERRRG